MNRLALHKTGEHLAVTVVSRGVSCALAPRGLHLVTIAISKTGDLIHVESECSAGNATPLEAVERLGGECCANQVPSILALVNGDDEHNDTPDAVITNVLRDTVSRARDKRTKRSRAQRMDNDELLSVALMARGLKLITERARKITRLPVFFSSDTEDRVWKMGLLHTHLGSREMGSRGWHFDEFELRAQLKKTGETHGIYAVNAGGASYGPEKENTFCMACNKRIKNRSSHSKTNRHVDNIISGARKAMRSFPGPK